MAADLIENYEGKLDAFQFIKDVPVDWDTSFTVDGKIEEYVVSVRKDINSEDWYLGAITNENERNLTIALDFLKEGAAYEAHIYADADTTHYLNNPASYQITKNRVDASQNLSLTLAPGGGVAVRFKLVEN